MAYLQNDQIQKILQSGSKPEELTSCLKHDIRAKFHIEPTLEQSRLQYKNEYLQWIGKIISAKKVEVFTQMMTLPIETVEFTEGVFDELNKIFEASDRYVATKFTNPELANDFNEYLKQIGNDSFWRNSGFQAMKTAINSVMILDLPPVDKQSDRFPQPYYYLLDVQHIKRCEVNDKFKFEYIVFCNKYNEKIYYVFDDGFYRTYLLDGSNFKLVSEVPHDLGYTPARSFWTTPFDTCSRIQKRGPQSNSLGRFDWLLALYTFTKHVELYAGFPIDVMYEQRCDYRDASGNTCEGGKIRRIMNTTIAGDAQQIVFDDCPNCKDKQILGPGTILIAPGMASKDDPDLIQGMNRISADKDSLEYLLKRVQQLEASISTNMIGYVAEGIREAMNKEQVASMIESQRNCLSEVAENFENIEKWTVEGLARLRYGSGAVLSVTCNYGNKWFIHSVETLQNQFKDSKSNGFSNFELSNQFEQILLTKYKNNPEMLDRVKTLVAIEPYQNYTVAELSTLSDKFGLNRDLIRLKIDFYSYISRFEREYTDIASFMQFSPFNEKILFIQDKLLQYVQEDYSEEEVEETEPGTPPILS